MIAGTQGLALMSSCAEHNCRLREVSEVRATLVLGREMHLEPLEAPRATLDRYTYQALTTGRVVLPGRAVHAGVWFRLLRCLLEEVSLAASSQNAHGKAVLRQIWQATGHPERAGLNVWRPYEQMGEDIREAMLDAAATALQLAADGAITARGRLGSALQSLHHHIYDGDRPSPYRNAPAGRHDRDGSGSRSGPYRPRYRGQLLALLTVGCRTLDRFEEERSYLFGTGVPAEFLPSARELGRVDLI
jgi:hypothetical protein